MFVYLHSGTYYEPELVEVFINNFTRFKDVLERYPESFDILPEN